MKRTDIQISDALEAFKTVTVKHDLQEQALKTVLFLLEFSPNTSIINLIGPTGAGKSALLRRVHSALIEKHRAEMERDGTFVPVIHTSAMATGYRLFDWKAFYSSALAALGDPFFAGRANRGSYSRYDIEPAPFKRAGESHTAAALRTRLETELRLRRTQAWIIDEAQHLVFGGRSGRPGDQFDVLKSIADSTGVKLLPTGPHQMEPALGSSGQLARRSATVNFQRYQSTNPDHLKTFASVANTLLKAMEVGGYPAVRESLPFLYSGSAGCVGILKDWLARAYGSVLGQHADDMAPLLTLDHLRQTRLSLNAMDTIMADIRSAEEQAQGEAGDADYVRVVLGGAGQQAARQAHKPASNRGRRVGVRLPARDPVPTSDIPLSGNERVAIEEVAA